jgi:magnesium transporter
VLPEASRTSGGPVPLSQVWIRDRVIARDVHGDDLADVLQQNGDASAWAVSPRSDTGELRRLAKILDLDDLAVNQLLEQGHRIRFAEVGATRLVRLRLPDLDRPAAGSDVSMIIADQVLIMLVDDQLGRELATMLSGSARRLAGAGADRAAQLVIDFMITRLADLATDLEARGDDLADELFGGEPLSRESKLNAFRLRRAVTALRRVAEPTREVVGELAASDADRSDLEIRHWTMIIDHANRVAGTLAVLAESLTTVFDTSLSLDNARLGDVMKRLSGWAAIIAVPTLITGFVGMNVKFWLDGTQLGFYLYLSIMVAAAVVLYVIFRRKSWI